MSICQFFLQGWCCFGYWCWNEHPYARTIRRCGWDKGNQRSSTVIQPSSFSKSSSLRGSRDQVKPSSCTLGSGPSPSSCGDLGLSQSSLTSLNSDEQKEEKKLLEGTVNDIKVLESSGQWVSFLNSPLKKKSSISGICHHEIPPDKDFLVA
ncbi:PREDICTED: nucleoporin-like protein 2-like [Elephantulus edwardii]|uniref:nucleoporin-like protein 2-like n=1 Tax=Elephantulus edwardii TaxID=28737 RepID=UPI0003F0AE88|nr:PREDICTED: nucleoporin-like protein 2-like [Elephantulus edwardii]